MYPTKLRLLILRARGTPTLEQAAIDEEAVRTDLEAETGARDLTGGSVKGQPHAVTPMR